MNTHKLSISRDEAQLITLASHGWQPSPPLSRLRGAEVSIGDVPIGNLSSASVRHGRAHASISLRDRDSSFVVDLMRHADDQVRIISSTAEMSIEQDLSFGFEHVSNEHGSHLSTVHIDGSEWNFVDTAVGNTIAWYADISPISMFAPTNFRLQVLDNSDSKDGPLTRRTVGGTWFPASSGNVVLLHSRSPRGLATRQRPRPCFILSSESTDNFLLDIDAFDKDLAALRFAHGVPAHIEQLVGIDVSGRVSHAVGRPFFSMPDAQALFTSIEVGSENDEWFGLTVAVLRQEAYAAEWSLVEQWIRLLAESTSDSIVARIVLAREILQTMVVQQYQLPIFSKEGTSIWDRLQSLSLSSLRDIDDAERWGDIVQLLYFSVRLCVGVITHRFGLAGRITLPASSRASRHGMTSTDEWWRFGDESRQTTSIQSFSDDVVVSPEIAGDRWPDFRLPEPPSGPFWLLIEQYLSELNTKTFGLVRGRILPSGHQSFEVQVYGASNPNSRFTLDVISDVGKWYESKRYGERIDGGRSMHEYCSRLARDVDTIRLIERLIEIEFWSETK